MVASMKKSVFVAVGIALIAFAGYIRFITPKADDLGVNHATSTGWANLVVTLGDRTFIMSNGFAAQEALPRSISQDTIRVIGEPAFGDGNRDGQRDAALVIENDPGGGGAFYYAVLAVNDAGSYRATNALLLGDRIAPLTLDFLDGRFVYNYYERGPGEPMTARPSVRKSLWIRFDRAAGVISAGA